MNKSNINALNDTNLVSPHQLILPLNYSTVIKEPTPREPSFFHNSIFAFSEALRLFVFLEAPRLFYFFPQYSLNCCLYNLAPPLAGWRKVACTSIPYSAKVRLAFWPTPRMCALGNRSNNCFV